MAGTHIGGRKAAARNRQRYGLDFYKQVGRKGGAISRGGGFAYDRELAIEAGRKGGSISRRVPKKIQSDYVESETVEEPVSFLRKLSVKIGLPQR